jgi:hypothetical protein
MRARKTWRSDWLVTFALPWICVLAVSVMIAWVANVALIDAFNARQTVPWVSLTLDTTYSDHAAGLLVTCDTRSARMVYVAALSECFPAEW